jgi:taurine--2-oxoglutarate transaminase
MDFDTIKELDREYLMSSWSAQKARDPVVITDVKGNYIYSGDKKILDFGSQLMCVNAGHKDPRIVNAIKEQAEKISFVSPGFAEEARSKLVKKLAEITPGNLVKTFLSTSGTEANEAAVKVAKFFTSKFKILTRYRSYHGSTGVSIALTGDPRRIPTEPGFPGILHIPDTYCYRCPFGKEYPGCDLQCARFLDEMICLEGPSTVAAILIEPIIGSNGILVPPDDYMPYLREICDKYEVLLIDDEVMTGFGRTGKMFAIEHWDVVPDIMTMAKGLTSSYVPLGATIFSSDIAEFFEDNIFMHGHTYAGHSLACAAALATISVYEEDRLVENAAKMGDYLLKRLKEIGEDHKSVGDVRGKGLFCGIELVRNRETKEPMATRETKLTGEPTVPAMVAKEAFSKGVYLVQMISTLIMAPPLTITKDEIDFAVDVIDQALDVADKHTE